MLFPEVGQHGRIAQVLPAIPIGFVGGVVVFQKLALLLSVLGGLQGIKAVGRVAWRAHDDVGFPRVGAEWVGKLVVSFAGPGFPDAALYRSVRAQQVGAALHRDVVFFRQFVDAFQADVAPGSNVVVPDDDVYRVGVFGVVVGRRLLRGGHGGTSAGLDSRFRGNDR